MTSAQRDECRLTEADEDAMRAVLRRTLREWRYGPSNIVNGVEADTLERLAAHAIGCSTYDLRDSERQWIANEIGEVLFDL